MVKPKVQSLPNEKIEWPSNILTTCDDKFGTPNGPSVSFSNGYATGRFLLQTFLPTMSEDVEKCFVDNCNLFNFQLQFKLSQALPENMELFAGLEVSTHLNFSFAVNYFITSTLLVYVSTFVENFHISYGDDVENAHLCVPFHTLTDTLIVTTDDQITPTLNLGKLNAPVAKVNSPVKLETGLTYTCSFSSDVLYLEKWSLSNCPGIKFCCFSSANCLGIREVPLGRLWGSVPIHFVLYAVPSGCNKHNTSERIMICDVEIRHASNNMSMK